MECELQCGGEGEPIDGYERKEESSREGHFLNATVEFLLVLSTR